MTVIHGKSLLLSKDDVLTWMFIRCWSVKFVTVEDFKDTVCMDDRLCENISKRMANSRSTSLSSLHLRPSAPLPVYRVNLPGLGQADITVGITDSEESYDDDNYYEDGVTDEDLMHLSDEESFAPAVMLRQLELSDEWRQRRDMALQRWNEGEPAQLDDSVAEGPTEDEDDHDENIDIASAIGPTLEDTEDEDEQHNHGSSQHEDEQHNDESSQHEDEDMTMTLPEDLPASTTWDPHSDYDYDSDWFEQDDDDENVIFTLPGANGGHRLLSPAEHRILRDRLMAERGPFHIRTTPTVQPIPVSTKGGWSDNSEDEDENTDEQSQTTHDALEESEDEDYQPSKTQGKKKRILAHTMRSSNVVFYRKKRRSYERLMLTTPKDLIMLKTSKGRMMTERMERNVISSVDVRSDRLLVAMDRLNMVQWIPSLELFIAASQKGTVALLRILQVKLPDGQHTPIFNHERYLPDHDMQRRPLYGKMEDILCTLLTHSHDL